MLTVLLVLQVIVTVSMIVVILIQRNNSDGMAGLAGGGNSLMSGRASANLLTRITSVLATIFIINSLAMAAISARTSKSEKSLIDDIKIEQKAPSAPIADKPVENTAPVDAAKDPAKTESGKDAKPETQKTPVKEERKVKEEEKKESKPVVPIAE